MNKGKGRVSELKKKNTPLGVLIFILAVAAALYVTFPELGSSVPAPDGVMEVHFIDVGQGDAVLIKTAEACVLVDGGDNQTRDGLLAYLKEQDIHTLDLVVGTHPHSDHIGGLAGVINELTVNKIMMPKAETTTETFKRLLLAVQAKGLKISAPSAEEVFSIGSLRFSALAPSGDWQGDLNNASIVLKVTYGEVDLLLTGDAEAASEETMLKKGYDLRARVLKVGHHGSNTSTGQAFLEAVKPEIAVISCGKDNTYGHPNLEVLERLEAEGTSVLRTDELGDIVLFTDGQTIWRN